jgi:hypothetical protein
MKALRKLEQVYIHNLRENMLKNHKTACKYNNYNK